MNSQDVIYFNRKSKENLNSLDVIYFNRKSWEIYIYQLGFTGAVQFRDGTLDPSDVRVKCPISELGATVKITNSNIIIKISHPKQWESDSAQENHTLPCNITLKINEFEKLRSIPSTRIKHRIRDNVTGYMLD